MLINFIFIGEGTSDDALISHLETLCIESGATEVTGTSLDSQRLPKQVGHTIEAKLEAALNLEPDVHLVFVHRDSDGRSSAARYSEIRQAAEKCGCAQPVICVVPVQSTEAWLLLDEEAIRRVVGRPKGTVQLNLPKPHEVEKAAKPKLRLQEALMIASEASGRRLERIKQDFSYHRRALLQDLPTSGFLETVESWTNLRQDLKLALVTLENKFD